MNKFYTVVHDESANVCICNVHSLIGSDIYFKSKDPTVEEMSVKYQLVDEVKPIHLGENINAICSLMKHPDLHSKLEELQEQGKTLMLIIHHNNEKTHAVLDRVRKDCIYAHW